ncbi:TadE/TadG family type IV pilus assembly protein [Pseudomonas sp. TCU-HL1]|uniref:TadE/TadG family type IV pilus assembly protein n=1 Tax=Pseudomonas sp. TCU-HL1 TaxID=1856685 RepID=UPI00083E0177|nr:TadE/TadG family type IV pilus assembly protein [Pseudomonas sp. TCU-HL1]AOE87646.1 pilus assembly protein TadE [Pseudomonas sp. TCU-HL1]
MRKGVSPRFARQQKGAAALEFSLVFIIFFAIFYGVIGYTLPLLMLQSFNQASAEAVRRAVAVNPDASNFLALATAEANTAINQQLAWLPAGVRANLPAPSVTLANGVLTVSVSYPYGASPVVPPIPLPGIGSVPRVPAVLSAQASIQVQQ